MFLEALCSGNTIDLLSKVKGAGRAFFWFDCRTIFEPSPLLYLGFAKVLITL
jgi:hypothetical protein